MEGVLLALIAAAFVISGVFLSAWNNSKMRKQNAAEKRSIPLNTELVEAAERDTKSHDRSVAKQIERWAHIGRICELNSDFDYENVAQALRGDVSPDRLSAIERAVYDAEFGERMRYPGPGEDAFFARQAQQIARSSFDDSELGH